MLKFFTLLTTAVLARRKGPLPTFKDIWATTVDVMLQDLPLLEMAPEPEVLFKDPSLDDLSCDEMVNQLILDLPKFGSFFYFLMNGAYLGQMGDYASCQSMTING
jgi:hypothetical protein